MSTKNRRVLGEAVFSLARTATDFFHAKQNHCLQNVAEGGQGKSARRQQR